MTSKISIPLKKLSKSSFDLAEKSFDSELPGEWLASWEIKNIFINTYIQEKFKDVLHIVEFVNFLILYDEELKKTVFRLGNYSNMETLFFDKDSFETYLKRFRNTKKRFTFFPISTATLNSNKDGLDYHGISALYDKQTHKVEIFDSIGSNFSNYEKTFRDFFTQTYGAKVKIVYMVERCASFGKLEAERCSPWFYKYNAEGFCAIWVLWFLELRLANPNIPKEKLIEKALTSLKNKDKVCRFLRGYAQFVDKTFSKYSIVRTSSNLMIKPKNFKSSVYTKKDFSVLYILLASLLGSIAAFGILKRLKKK